MKITLQATVIIAAIFAVVCLGVAFTGFTSLAEMDDPAQLADAKGFAWFWTFLGSVAMAFGMMSWWLIRTGKESDGA